MLDEVHEFDYDKEGTGVMACCSECDWGMNVPLFESYSIAKSLFTEFHKEMVTA